MSDTEEKVVDRELLNAEENESVAVDEEIYGHGGSLYVDNSYKAKDNKSSGYILLGVGIVGTVAVILSMLGLIKLRFGNSYLFYGCMIALFILFIVMGAVSLINGKKFEKQSKGDKSVKDSLLEWADENLTAEMIDSNINNISDYNSGELFFKRIDIISKILNKQFLNVDQAMLDNLIDTIIYDKIYGDEAE